jgi:hypothetical protein
MPARAPWSPSSVTAESRRIHAGGPLRRAPRHARPVAGRSPELSCGSMIPLAVSGTVVIGVAVVGAVLLLAFLLRSEDRYEAEHEREDDR